MAKYAFTFKKGDVFAEFITTDKEVVERQFQIWVASADDYVKKGLRKSGVSPAQKTETEPEKTKEIEQKIEAGQEQPVEQSEVFDKASGLLKTINIIQEESREKSESPEEKNEGEVVEIKKVEEPAETKNFEEVLEKTIENPTFEPAKTQDRVFLNLINSKNTNDKFHYLIITAYYLTEFEKMERFSLKQINAKLMHNLSEVIDHTTLQEAINQNFIDLVPDLTGTSEVGEYRLTPAGEDFFANKI